MDYKEFFNLNEHPFKPTLETKFFYPGEAFEELCQLLSAPQLPPILLLSGNLGSGRSTLIKRIPKAISETVKMSPVLNPGSKLGDIIRQSLTFLGLGFKCTPRIREEELIGFFQNAVTEYVNNGLNFILAVDDCEVLDDETLDDLLILTKLEPGWAGRVCLLLVCPADYCPPAEEAEQADVFLVKPFSFQESQNYIEQRMFAAGAIRSHFSPEALTALQSYSSGLPQKINTLADKSLMSAWAAGKNYITNGHVVQAKFNLDNPLTVDTKAAKGAAGSERIHHKISSRSWLSLLAAVLIVGAMVWLLWPTAKDEIVAEVLPEELSDPEPILPGPEATPSADPAPSGGLGLPSLPPSVLNLPYNTSALVVETGQKLSRLWQGGNNRPGLKAEIAAPDFSEPGLYLIGRPKSRSAIVFRYPPGPSLPRTVAERLWRRVDSLLSQNILPLMVGSGENLAKTIPHTYGPKVKELFSLWVTAQKKKNAEQMTGLYAETFSFFEPGRKPVVIARHNFKYTLEAEFQASGEVRLTTSDPLIMIDPTNQDRAWAVFTLKYDSKIRHNIGLRTLIFEKNRSNEWLIVAELWLKEEIV
ncbi:MAG: nuclear transport factor 2 family protein [Deltaproteobacteria bacterium]|jgi:type II secretory pathway predicted ATPase ExeA|nr:nuclear transport factor 2 family protein [Deltaproteobacteria bacterium]